MPGTVVAAGVDARELKLAVRFLQRDPALVRDADSPAALAEALAHDPPSLVVLGAGLETPLLDLVRLARKAAAGQALSILAIVPAAELPGTEGLLLGEGANAALRRPLDQFVLESWVAKLLDVPRRVLARIPVHVQVVGNLRGAASEHFYGLSRNLSVHGMLLASPVRIEGEDLDLELDLPEPEGRVRVLGRIVREAPEVGWPYFGYGIEFLFLPEAGQRSIQRMVRREAAPDAARSLWSPGAIHSTVRIEGWIYEMTEPARTDGGFLVEIRRAERSVWRPGRAGPFSVVRAEAALAALAAAREFVRRHG